MKIAFLSQSSGINFRGVETTTHLLANYLTKSHEVTVYCGGTKKYENQKYTTKIFVVKEFSKNKFTDIYNKFVWRFFLDLPSLNTLFFALKISKNLIKHKYDVIFPGNGFWQIIILKVLKIFLRHKIIIIGHSGFGWSERLSIYLSPDVFVMQTPEGEKYAKRIRKNLKIKMIPSGVDTSIFAPLKKYKKSESSKILCVASFVEYKRIQNVIKAFEYLSEKFELEILGQGPLEDELRNLAKKYVKGRWEIKHLPFDKVINEYQKCDLFCLPSKPQEALGLVILEAMACNKPVVVNDDAVRRWMVQNAGILVDCSNPKEIAEAINRVTKIDWGQIPRNQSLKFDTHKLFKEYDNLITELI